VKAKRFYGTFATERDGDGSCVHADTFSAANHSAERSAGILTISGRAVALVRPR
jgi:hypothetical protein